MKALARTQVSSGWAVIAALSLGVTAFGYPSTIRHGYTACSTCHADPAGGGLLTAYGRAAGELLLRSPYGASKERDPGKIGNFAFGAFDLPEQVLLGAAVRTLMMSSGPLGGESRLRYFPMQLDAIAQVTVSRLRANLSLGYGQGARTQPITLVKSSGPQAVSRQHWLGLDLGEDKQWLLRLGRMAVPFGLRTHEHILWVRSETRTDTNVGQQHGLALAYTGSGIRGEAMLLAGNLFLNPPDYRELGYSAFAEAAPLERFSLGASSLIAHAFLDVATAAPMWRHAHGVFARFSPHPLLVLSTEHDFTLFSQPNAVNLWGLVSMAQLDLEPYQGVHLIATGELRNKGLGHRDSGLGGWGSVAWFFAPHADLRADVIWRREAPSVVAPDPVPSLTALLQFHLYL